MVKDESNDGNFLTNQLDTADVIVLVDSDDDHGVDHAIDDVAVALMCSILHCSRRDAQQHLHATNGNLQAAIERALHTDASSGANVASHPARRHEANQCRPTSRNEPQPRPTNHQREFLETKTFQAPVNQPPTAKRKLSFGHDDGLDDAEAMTITNDGQFDPVWYACVQRTKMAHDHFIDSDFPPAAQSLDGRQRLDRGSEAINCHCGVRAAAKQVQTDGPNYGRFYLSCGQVQRRRARVVPVRQRIDEKQEQTTEEGVRNPYQKRAPPKSPPPKTPPSSPPTPQRRNCNFFQWDATGSLGAANRSPRGAASDACGYSQSGQRLTWFRFGLEQQCTLYQGQMVASHVRQGAVGNCWFLSALAVVAEQPRLMQAIVPHTTLNEIGCYQINLFLDGAWQPVLVDSYLPVVLVDLEGSKGSTTTRDVSRWRDGIPVQIKPSNKSVSALTTSSTVFALPAFCAAPQRQLWCALVEKAYAKVHASYRQLSGGFIAEGLQDLTGAPTETIIIFAAGFLDVDTTWARLLSFAAAGFLMGVATAQGGDGLVGGHAYSVLEVLEVSDSIVGEQCKVTDFFRAKKPVAKVDADDGPQVQSSDAGHTSQVAQRGARTTVRLVRIRNPWGNREWKGDWSADSEQWTRALRKRLGSTTSVKGDGTFYMSFTDMLQRFHHMDVAKTQLGWVHSSAEGSFGRSSDPLQSSSFSFSLTSSETTQAFITIIQPKKRSNTQTKYWYCDPSMILMRRLHTECNTGEWESVACALTGVKRQIHVDVFLEAGYTYVCLPFSCLASKALDFQSTFSFRLATYSCKPLNITPLPNDTVEAEKVRTAALRLIHRAVLSKETKLTYPLSICGSLVCTHGDGSLYFMAINGALDQYLSLRLTVDLPDGLLVIFGLSEQSVDIPPRSQRLLTIVSSAGKRSSATSFCFRYLSSCVQSTTSQLSHRQGPIEAQSQRLGSVLPLSLAGELIADGVDPRSTCMSGGATIDTYMWIPQLGAGRT